MCSSVPAQVGLPDTARRSSISSCSSEGPGPGIFPFPSRAWISAQQGICSRDVNSNLCCALTDLSSGLFDNIPKCKKLGVDSLIRLQDKGLL